MLAAGQDVPIRALHPGRPIGAGNIRQLAYSPDGQLLAIVTTVGFQIRDAKSGRLLRSVVDDLPAGPRSDQAARWLSELCWSPDGKRIVRIATGIEIWNWTGSRPERVLPANTADKAFHALACSPTGQRIAVRSESGIVVWNLNSGQRITIAARPPNQSEGNIGGFSWSPDGEQLALVQGERKLEVLDVWDVSRQMRIKRIRVGQKLKSYSFALFGSVP